MPHSLLVKVVFVAVVLIADCKLKALSICNTLLCSVSESQRLMLKSAIHLVRWIVVAVVGDRWMASPFIRLMAHWQLSGRTAVSASGTKMLGPSWRRPNSWISRSHAVVSTHMATSLHMRRVTTGPRCVLLQSFVIHTVIQHMRWKCKAYWRHVKRVVTYIFIEKIGEDKVEKIMAGTCVRRDNLLQLSVEGTMLGKRADQRYYESSELWWTKVMCRRSGKLEAGPTVDLL